MPDKQSIKPPVWIRSFFRWFCKQEYQEDLEGDLLERFDSRIQEQGLKRARQLFILDVLRLFRPGLIRAISGTEYLNPNAMYRNYFKIVWRNSIKNKTYSLINILGLATGMGVCLLIYQYIYFELSYDNFHHDYQNTYRVIIEDINSELNETYPTIGYSFGIAAMQEIPEIKQYVRKERFNRGAIVTNSINKSVFHEEINDLLFVDKSFFEVFNFPLKLGNKESMFENKYGIVITEKTAQKYFGSDNPIGKTLKVSGPPSPGDYTVTGVLEDIPSNSHLQFDFLIPIENYIEYGWGGAVKKQGGWGGFSVVTYLNINQSANLELVAEKLSELIARNNKESNGEKDIVKKVILQPIADVYMKSQGYTDPGFLTTSGNIKNIKIFSVISIFILLIAYINYINLSTARSMHRAKEVGVRKSVGAHKGQLTSQFILETILFNVASAIIALGIAYLTLPVLNNIIGKELELSVLYIPSFWGWFSMIILLGSLLSGFYPAFILASYKPVSMLGSIKIIRFGNFNLQRGLIVFQFLASMLLISGTYLVYKQTGFMKGQDLSIDMEKIVGIRALQVGGDGDKAISKYQAFKNEMTRHHSITSVSGSLLIPGQFWILRYRRLGEAESGAPHVRGFFAGRDFEKTYGLEFIAGGPFAKGMSDERFAIVNEAAVSAFGLGSPEEAIQEKLAIGKNTNTIVGVVKNFHWHSVKEAHTPYVINLKDSVLHPYISIRMNLSNVSETLLHIESTYRTFFPDYPYEYFFVDEVFNRQYQAELQFGKLLFAFTILAIFVSCIGLFALVSYSTTLRIKEIGIRKVLGANATNLMMLLSKEYLKLILVAIIIATPVVFYWGSSWLENYALKINLGIELFAIPGLMLVVISLFTVSYNTYSAATINPAESLRSE